MRDLRPQIGLSRDPNSLILAIFGISSLKEVGQMILKLLWLLSKLSFKNS